MGKRSVGRTVRFAMLLVAVGWSGAARAQVATINATQVGRWDNYPGTYSDCWVSGDYAYISNWPLADGQLAQVHIIDISDPANPVLDNTFVVPPPNQFTSPQDVKVYNGLLFIALESGGSDSVAIVDVRDPTSPVQIATVRIAGFISIHNLFYEDGFLYLADSRTPNIPIVDLRGLDPDNPPGSPITATHWLITGVGQFVHDVTVRDGRLYAASWNSLRIYDASDVANTMPFLIGQVAGSATHSMWPTDDGQYVVTGEERFGGGIKVYRMTDTGGALSLTLTDSHVISPGASSVHNQMIIGNRLYNSWYEAGLQVFDINSTTGELEFFASFDTASAWGVNPLLGDDRILISDMSNGLYILALGDSPVSAPLPATAPHDQAKNRFLSFKPTNPALSTAIRVDLLDLACSSTGALCASAADCMQCVAGDADGQPCAVNSDCPGGACLVSGETCDEQSPPVELGWVSAPFQPATGQTPPGTMTALVNPTPVFRTWSESVVHLGDCEIAPTQVYGLRATMNGVTFTDPLIVRTTLVPQGKFWGDVAGSFNGVSWSGPNRLVNVDDVVAVVKFLVAAPAPHITALDLGGEVPNFIINATDLQFVLAGFASNTYPPPPFANQGGPTGCP